MAVKFTFKRAAAALLLSTSTLLMMTARDADRPEKNEDATKSARATIKPPKGWPDLPEPPPFQEGTVEFADRAGDTRGLGAKRIAAEGGGKDSVLGALFKYASTHSPDMACMASATNELLDDIQRRKGASRADAAIELVKALTPDQIRAFSVEGRTELISPMLRQTDTDDPVNDSLYPGELFFALRKVYANSEEDPVFNSWDEKKKVELTSVLRDDPVLTKARSQWRKLKDNDRMNVMRRVMDLTMKTYGGEFGMTNVPFYYAKHPDKNVMGFYIPSYRTMYLNIDSPDVPENFEITAGVAAHETLHVFHHQLVDQMEQGKINPQHDVYKYARFMQESYFRYLANKYNDYTAYRSNPTEKHAWEMQPVGSYIGAGSGKSMKKIEDSSAKASQNKDDFAVRREREIEAARASNAICAPVQLIK